MGGYTLAAPKLLDKEGMDITLFMPMITTEGANTIHYLLAVNSNGELLEQEQHASYPPEGITGTDWGGIWDSIWDFISSPIDFDGSGIPSEESINRLWKLNL